MAIGNDNGGGVEYEIEPSSGGGGGGGGGNLVAGATAGALFSVLAGASFYCGCWGGMGDVWTMLGFGLLTVSVVLQVFTIYRLRNPSPQRLDGSRVASSARAASAPTGGNGKTSIAPGFTDAVHTFDGNGEVVVFWHDQAHGGDELCRSVPIHCQKAEVRLQGSKSAGYTVKTTQTTP